MDQCLLFPISCPWMQSLSSPGPQAHIKLHHQLPSGMGKPTGCKREFYGGGSVEAVWFSFSPPLTCEHQCMVFAGLFGSSGEQTALMGAQLAPVIPYQHAFDCVPLVPFLFPHLCLCWFYPSILSLPGSFSGAVTVGQFVYGKSV